MKKVKAACLGFGEVNTPVDVIVRKFKWKDIKGLFAVKKKEEVK